MIAREQILKRLKAQISINGHVLAAVAGSGMTAKYSALGGADFLLALSAGKYRLMGRSSYASYHCYGNSNQIVMELGTKELLPIISNIPILFGLFASDPFISLYEYIGKIKESGFSGIVNFPTVALIDGKFREALEEDGNTYAREVEAIHLANFMNLFTVAFVKDEAQAREMAMAGADVICAHLGLTKGGYLGAKKYISIEQARVMTNEIFEVCDEIRPNIIKMIYAGPANTPIDMQYLYQNTKCQGYIGGSTFDRIPTERAILNTTKAFKSYGGFGSDDLMAKLTNGNWNTGDYAEFVKKYIEEHYMKEIYLSDLALVAHVSPSYLSVRFKQEIGCSFTDYLIRYRMNKAKEILRTKRLPLKDVAMMVGYKDYVQFSKMFKKLEGISPRSFVESNINTSSNHKNT